MTSSLQVHQQFYEAYKNDSEMKQVNVFMCFHPTAMCEVFMPFNRTLIVIASTRYELGRFAKEDWTRWNKNLQKIASDPRTVLAGVLIVHYLPAFCFTFTAGGLAVAIGGLIVAIGLGISCVIGAINCSQIRAVYDRCVTELKTLIMKYMPALLGKSIDTVTKEQLHQAIKDGLDEFKIKEDIWLDRDILKALQRQVDRNLARLKESI
ncbi:unnamed protein product [Rotaria socialis]